MKRFYPKKNRFDASKSRIVFLCHSILGNVHFTTNNLAFKSWTLPVCIVLHEYLSVFYAFNASLYSYNTFLISSLYMYIVHVATLYSRWYNMELLSFYFDFIVVMFHFQFVIDLFHADNTGLRIPFPNWKNIRKIESSVTFS